MGWHKVAQGWPSGASAPGGRHLGALREEFGLASADSLTGVPNREGRSEAHALYGTKANASREYVHLCALFA